MLKRSAYLAPVALVLVAGLVLYPKGDSRLIGTWVLDPAAIMELEEFRRYPEQQRAAALQVLSAVHLELTFTRSEVRFESDFGGKRQSKKGSYKVKSSKGDRLVVSFYRNDRWEDDVVEIRGDHLVIRHDGHPVALRRK